MPEETNERQIQSVHKAFVIVDELLDRGTAGPAELGRALDMSRGTVHAYLQTLAELNLLTRTDEGYRLALGHLRYGGYVRDTLYGDLYSTAKPEIDELATTTGEKAQISVVEDGRGYILYQALTDRAVRTDSHTGAVQPLHATASGKAYLSCLDEAELTETLDALDMAAYTDQTITDPDDLRPILDRVRSEGVAIDDGERIDGICCLAAPVVTDDGDPIGAISVSLPEYRWENIDPMEELKPIVENTARVIGLNVTYM
jgi:DNA-binding IclR family transcriptional regulator